MAILDLANEAVPLPAQIVLEETIGSHLKY